jgi:phage gp36-like protein
MPLTAYAGAEDLKKRYGREIDELVLAEGKAPGSLEAALEDAAAEIDGYVGQRYRLPLPTGKIYPALRWLSCDIARFRLWESRAEDEGANPVYVRYKKALEFLKGIAEGKIALLDEDGLEPETAPGAMGLAVEARRRQAFGPRTMRRMDYGS